MRGAGGGTGPTRRLLLGGALALLPAPARAAPDLITFDGLYESYGVRGLVFAPRLLGLRGREVALRGYMAPPLKAESAFFVLTAAPLALCPFCQSDADWPADIVVVRLRGLSPLVGAGTRIAVTGRLEVGSAVDPDTGFVSQVRLVDAAFRGA